MNDASPHTPDAPVRLRSYKAPSRRVIFAETAGVSRKLAASILSRAKHQIASFDTQATLKRVRFVPSTRVEVDGGFQVLADTTVKQGSRSVVLGAVVTVEGEGQNQTLKNLIIRNL